MSLITIIGRGHSGTRAISHTLYASGVYMGSSINPSGDKIPPQKMYDACRVLAQYVDWEGGLSWNFSRLFSEEIPNEFTDLISDYLQDVLNNKSEHKGWKIPETTSRSDQEATRPPQTPQAPQRTNRAPEPQ